MHFRCVGRETPSKIGCNAKMRLFARALAERARHILVSPPQARNFGRFGVRLRRTAWSSVQGVKNSHGNVVLHLPHQKPSRHGRRPAALHAEFQTGDLFASGRRQAGRANTDWLRMLFFTDRVRIQKNVGSKTPDSEPTRKCDFFRAPPPFHSLRKPFCVRRKRPPALLSEIWLDLA